tara:strand:- start:5260 stop:6276 length:1017 start_codon:yes stop_codon:yes gene_type:complete
MNFIDEVYIDVIAGKGGDGCLSFRRQKNLPKGGPDGGNGGSGGNVIFKASESLNTLSNFRYQKSFKAQNGKKGGSQNKTGSTGINLIIEVPCGTLIHNVSNEEELADLTENNQEFLIARGGDGGSGNLRYKSSTNQSPRKITKGDRGEERSVRLELSLLADVGLLGKPNAGKSSLVSCVSSAKPKIADYPFTTLHPSLGVVDYSALNSFVISDIPGIISGASEGIGLGHQFLKHLSRTSIILGVIDIYQKNEEDIVSELDDLIQELKKYDKSLVKKVKWLVLNKSDLLSEENSNKLIKKLKEKVGDKYKINLISSKTNQGIKNIIKDIGIYLENENIF